jgi:predicted neuraminidase
MPQPPQPQSAQEPQGHRATAGPLSSRLAWALRCAGRGFAAMASAACCAGEPQTDQSEPSASPMLKSGFIYETAPFPSCHASTIEDTGDGLLAAWFGGREEGASDVGIWTARYDGRNWTVPVEVVNGVQPGGEPRYPCWNPVLFQSDGGPLLLFYKVGPNPRSWWGMLMSSTNGGRTWSMPRRLPEGILGPIRSKPVLLPDGSLLCGSSTEDQGWRVHMERTTDLGLTWERSGALNDAREFGAIQPTILVWDQGRVQILNRSRQGRITECWMGATWKEWSPMQATALPNPSAGVDAVRLRDGRALLIYNDTPRGRTPLNLAVSPDGKDWKNVWAFETEPGEYSYPAIIQGRDGLVHVTYTWKRQKIRHVILDPKKL